MLDVDLNHNDSYACWFGSVMCYDNARGIPETCCFLFNTFFNWLSSLARDQDRMWWWRWMCDEVICDISRWEFLWNLSNIQVAIVSVFDSILISSFLNWITLNCAICWLDINFLIVKINFRFSSCHRTLNKHQQSQSIAVLAFIMKSSSTMSRKLPRSF